MLLQADQPMLLSSMSDGTACVTSPPRRSVSNPDMTRFKFRLTSSKPPVHPESVSKLLRQQILTEESLPTADSDMPAKSHCDRHCDQERLFHQLDKKLTLHAPRPTISSGDSPPICPSVSMLSLVDDHTQLQSGPLTATDAVISASVTSTNTVATASYLCQDAAESSSAGELYQPSTPIRREDSLPLHKQEDNTSEESLFAAIYEQTNVLLRNLHFERLSRRATTA